MQFSDLSSERVAKALKKAGFEVSKHSSTKHLGMSDGRYRVSIPRHKRLNPYTLKAIIRQAGLSDEEFKKLI